MRKWFIVSAVGRDRPGIVADLAQLVYGCDANLEDSRMTILGNEFAAIMLCSGLSDELGERLGAGARRLEWQNRLTVMIRPILLDYCPLFKKIFRTIRLNIPAPVMIGTNHAVTIPPAKENAPLKWFFKKTGIPRAE